MVNAQEMDPKLKKKTSKRKRKAQASQGLSNLRIPLNTGNSPQGGGSAGGALNIPKK